jgi:LmbE family N-acetylglucosaminyl deacetylase
VSRTLLIAPHADDESLFAAYLAQRYAAHVHVVYDEGRESELSLATTWLGCGYSQGNVPKGSSADVVEASLIGLRDPSGADDWERVIVPAVEDSGHEEHNLVGELALTTFSDVELIRYSTYAPRGIRMTWNVETFPDQPVHVARKLAALSCYRTQIEDPATAPWFYSLLDMREWIA